MISSLPNYSNKCYFLFSLFVFDPCSKQAETGIRTFVTTPSLVGGVSKVIQGELGGKRGGHTVKTGEGMCFERQ